MMLNKNLFLCLVISVVAGTTISPMERDSCLSDEQSTMKRKRGRPVKETQHCQPRCCLSGNYCGFENEVCGAVFTEDAQGLKSFFEHVEQGIKNYCKQCHSERSELPYGSLKTWQTTCPWKGCNKKFTGSNLQRDILCHLRNYHTGERPFVCKECPSYSGAMPEYLQKHIVHHHQTLSKDIVFTWYPKLATSMHNNFIEEQTNELTSSIDIQGGLADEIKQYDELFNNEERYFEVEFDGETFRLEKLV